MGGVIILSAILIPTLLFAKLDNIYVILMLITTLWMGFIGFLDDYIKVFKKEKEGLAGKFKILGQVSLGLIVGSILYFHPDVVMREQVEKLAKLARETGVGIVCSGHEAKNVRKIIGSNLLIFTPGIRLNKDNKDDQLRVCTPMESIKNGSDKIIMGRSLMKGNIEENLNQVAASIKI